MDVQDGIYRITRPGGKATLYVAKDGFVTDHNGYALDLDRVLYYGCTIEKCIVLTEEQYASLQENARMEGYNEGIRDKLRFYPEG